MAQGDRTGRGGQDRTEGQDRDRGIRQGQGDSTGTGSQDWNRGTGHPALPQGDTEGQDWHRGDRTGTGGQDRDRGDRTGTGGDRTGTGGIGQEQGGQDRHRGDGTPRQDTQQCMRWHRGDRTASPALPSLKSLPAAGTANRGHFSLVSHCSSKNIQGAPSLCTSLMLS